MAPRPKKIVDSSPVTEEKVKAPKISKKIEPMMEKKALVAETAAAQSPEVLKTEVKAETPEPIVPKAPERFVVPPSANPQSVRPMQNNMRPAFQPRYNSFNNNAQRFSRPIIASEPIVTEEITGIFDQTGTDGRGIVRASFRPGETDAVLQSMQARQVKLRPGDMVTGLARRPKENEPYWTMMQITKVNGEEPSKMFDRPRFEKGVPIYPFEKIKLETAKETLSTRLIDMVAPVGRGQRGLIVSPPKAGKTTVIKEIASGIATNYPEVHLMAVLVGERPEEVTDISRHILAITKNSEMPGETAASNFDEKAEDQTKVSELALERAKRLVEMGKDVVILLDSITRLARAYNLAIPTSGRTLSGGFDPAALYPPKKFFGAARKIEGGGSLTIIGTALTDTGSRMDDLVYEEFKGTGNMELHLDRRLAERRIYPAVDVMRSSTRRDDLLFESMEYQSIILMRRMLDMLNDGERTEVLAGRIARTKTNKEFLASLKDGG
jgi:transcription termination factor Rho